MRRTAQRLRFRLVRNEDGSTLIIAMMVMIILSTLSLAVLSRTLSSMAFIRHGQDYDAALAAADAGLSDALYKIDQTAPATWTYTGTSGAGTYSYKAIKKDATEYEVRSIGEVGRSKHGIRAKVNRSARYPFVLFSNQDMTLNGSTVLDIFTIRLGVPVSGDANLGSNGKIIVNSGAGAGDAQHYYAPNGGCIGCPVPVEHKEGAYKLEPVVAPAGAAACPGTYVALTDSYLITGPVTPGTYKCTKKVTFTGVVDVFGAGAFILYLVPATPTSPAPALDISTAIINPLGKSRDFQIHKAGDGELRVPIGGGSAPALSYNGIMYAPDSTVTINGGIHWVGSWVVNKAVVNGGPTIKIGYDLDLETYLGVDWKVSRYAEVSSASIPLT